ncbi:uncharacterized protein V6R79_017002 [Siganus canaliculatus]
MKNTGRGPRCLQGPLASKPLIEPSVRRWVGSRLGRVDPPAEPGPDPVTGQVLEPPSGGAAEAPGDGTGSGKTSVSQRSFQGQDARAGPDPCCQTRSQDQTGSLLPDQEPELDRIPAARPGARAGPEQDQTGSLLEGLKLSRPGPDQEDQKDQEPAVGPDQEDQKDQEPEPGWELPGPGRRFKTKVQDQDQDQDQEQDTAGAAPASSSRPDGRLQAADGASMNQAASGAVAGRRWNQRRLQVTAGRDHVGGAGVSCQHEARGPAEAPLIHHTAAADRRPGGSEGAGSNPINNLSSSHRPRVCNSSHRPRVCSIHRSESAAAASGPSLQQQPQVPVYSSSSLRPQSAAATTGPSLQQQPQVPVCSSHRSESAAAATGPESAAATGPKSAAAATGPESAAFTGLSLQQQPQLPVCSSHRPQSAAAATGPSLQQPQVPVCSSSLRPQSAAAASGPSLQQQPQVPVYSSSSLRPQSAAAASGPSLQQQPQAPVCSSSHRPRVCSSHRPRVCSSSHRPRVYSIHRSESAAATGPESAAAQV